MVKKIIYSLVSIALLYLAYRLMLPWHKFTFEHFEYSIYRLFPFSWKTTAILSRLIISSILICGFYLIISFVKIKNIKYLSIIAGIIPFIINPVFISDLKDEKGLVSEELPYILNNVKESEIVLIAYFTNDCPYCKEAAIKINTAQTKNESFKRTIVISNNFNLKNYFEENNLNLELDTTSLKNILNQTNGRFPKFALIENNKILKKWTNAEFNYAVLDGLSK